MDPFNLFAKHARPATAIPGERAGARPLFFPAPSTATDNITTPIQTPRKARTLSDSGPSLIPSPTFNEVTRKTRDDHNLISTPSRTPRHIDLSARGLILQMPPRETSFGSPANQRNTAPLSPQVESREPREAYGSPSNVLPRHSRGLDFSRAATSLHHSTLVDHSSPDSSPTITQKNMFPPSRRASTHSMAMDSPRMPSAWSWTFGGNGVDKSAFPRSVASTNAMTSDASSDSSDDEDIVMRQDDSEEVILSTPQARKMEDWNVVTPFAQPANMGSTNGWMNNYSPSAPAFTNFRTGRHLSNQSRKSSDSIGGTSMAISPVLQPTTTNESQTSYFGNDINMTNTRSRRESLSMGTSSLNISSSRNETMDDNAFAMAPTPATPGVVRRPVTRRSNMLPKTKNFSRIRQMLQEESAPVDSETKREAEVVRQVRVNEAGIDRPAPGTEPSSPNLTPSMPRLPQDNSDISDIDPFALREFDAPQKSSSDSDSKSASWSKELRSYLYRRTQTPPPSMTNRGRSSSGVSEDTNVDSPKAGPSTSVCQGVSAGRSASDNKEDMDGCQETMQFQTPSAPSIAEISRKGKRRRDDDFDPHSFKRRAVSPGLSVQSSPILGQSPVSNGGSWPQQQQQSQNNNKGSREGSTGGPNDSHSASSMGQATPTLGPKRVGMQGMTDTHDGIMKMSIE